VNKRKRLELPGPDCWLRPGAVPWDLLHQGPDYPLQQRKVTFAGTTCSASATLRSYHRPGWTISPIIFMATLSQSLTNKNYFSGLQKNV